MRSPDADPLLDPEDPDLGAIREGQRVAVVVEAVVMADLEDMPEPFLPTRTVISKRTLLGNLSTAVVLAAHSDQRGAPTDRGEGRVGAPAAPPAGDAVLVLGRAVTVTLVRARQTAGQHEAPADGWRPGLHPRQH